jgi:TPR repeat protein
MPFPTALFILCMAFAPLVTTNASAGSLSELDVCDGSDFQVCLDQARKLATGDGRPQSPLAAFVLEWWMCGNYFEPACEAIRTPPRLPPDSIRVFESWLQSCRAGNATDCWAAGLAASVAKRTDSKWATAFERACELGEPRACARISFMLWNGRLPKDNTRALQLDQRTCSLIHFNCGRAAEAMLSGPKGSARRDEARALVEADCRGKHPLGCASLANLYQSGRLDGAPNLVAAARASASACELGEGPACNNVGELERSGALGQDQRAHAINSFRRGCSLRDAVSCVHVADDDVEHGRGAEATTAYEKLCQAGRADACNNLGTCIGRGICTGDKARAVEFFRRACDGKEKMGCRNLGWSLQQSWSGETDANKAWDAWRRSCDLGLADACYKVGTQYARVGNAAESRVALDRACHLAPRLCSSAPATDGGVP